MKISTILDHIDSGHLALPEFQRGYVWNRDQVRGLMDSLYRRHPVGSLLVWATESQGAPARGDGLLAQGKVKLLLDGQQRITSLYGIIRGKPPRFFDGNAQAFTGLYFHLAKEEFVFYSPLKMQGDLLWIDVTKLMQQDLDPFIDALSAHPQYTGQLGTYTKRLARITGIKDIPIHQEEVTGADKTIDMVVDIFNRVNSGGTKLSKGDLALAKVCAEWPDARAAMKNAMGKWRQAGYHFDLDWLLRNVNTVLTGEALFNALHDVPAEQFQDGLKRAVKACDYLLNLVAGRLGLDHDRVLFNRYAFPVMAHYVDRRGYKLDALEQDRLLFWYLHSALWGRFSGSTESVINKDLEPLENLEGGIDRLIEALKLWRGDLTVQPAHFGGWSLGARFYPMLYLMTRIGAARDWGTGLPLKSHLLGKHSQLHVHHIFPKALLYKHNYHRPDINAVANFCFLTQDSNLQIGDKAPQAYFEKVEANFPGALTSQWIPMDKTLWKVENYLDFLEVRKTLLADTANSLLRGLSHESTEPTVPIQPTMSLEPLEIQPPGIGVIDLQLPGAVDGEEEEQRLLACNAWVTERGLPEGEYLYELVHTNTGEPIAILDLAWPKGLQAELSEPIALLTGEEAQTLAAANQAGFKYFTSIEDFKKYVERDVLALEA